SAGWTIAPIAFLAAHGPHAEGKRCADSSCETRRKFPHPGTLARVPELSGVNLKPLAGGAVLAPHWSLGGTDQLHRAPDIAHGGCCRSCSDAFIHRRRRRAGLRQARSIGRVRPTRDVPLLDSAPQ